MSGDGDNGTGAVRLSEMDAELERLLNGCVDGTLSAGEEAELQAVLRGSAEARRVYRQFMALESGMQWSYAAVASGGDEVVEPARGVTGFPRWVAGLAVAAVLVLSAVLAGLLWPERALVEVVASYGEVGWEGAESGEVEAVAAGVSLGAGTLRLEGEASSVAVRFDDGTTFSVAGDSEVAFSEPGEGKRLWLRHGALVANVAPQPAGRPLVVRTPAAEVEVVGTAFSLLADGEQTALGVDHGEVNLKRLSDGETVAVAERRAAVARLEAGEAMDVVPWSAAPASWSGRVGQPGGEAMVSKGDVSGAGDGWVLGAVPYVAARRDDGTPVVRHGVSFRGDGGAGHGRDFVALAPDSVVRMRYRVQEADTALRVFLSTHGPGMSFAGNFEASLPAEAAGEWVWVTVPVAGMPPVDRRKGRAAATSVMLLLVSTSGGEAGLEVSDVAVAPVGEIDAILPMR